MKQRTWMTKKNGAPELIEAIISHLDAWRNNYPAPSQSTLPHLSTAVTIQTNLGWKGFLHGFTAVQWELAQHNYLLFKSSKQTGRRWIAALVKKLWETIWALWRYRNGLVHEATNTPIRKLNALLNITVLKELQFGLGNLPHNYAYLFQKKMSQVLKTSINQKKQWVLTVWSARDTLTPLHISTTQRHPLIASILTVWKHRIRQYEARQNQTS